MLFGVPVFNEEIEASLIAQLVKNGEKALVSSSSYKGANPIMGSHLQCKRSWFYSWGGKIHWRWDRLPTPVFLGFPGGSAGKESVCTAGDLGLIPGLGKYPGEGKGYPLQYFGLENSTTIQSMGLQRVGHDGATFTFT